MQLTQEYRLLLLLARTLSWKHVNATANIKRTVQFRAEVGSIRDQQVDLVFPATEHTVLRLVQTWWDFKVGLCRPHGGHGRQCTCCVRSCVPHPVVMLLLSLLGTAVKQANYPASQQ